MVNTKTGGADPCSYVLMNATMKGYNHMKHQQKDALTDVAGSLPAALPAGSAPAAASPGTVTDASGQAVTLGVNLARGGNGSGAVQAATPTAPTPSPAPVSSARSSMNFFSKK